jgi:mannose-6-phosphate isomerase-like protein (cupin superfamily)
MDMKGFVVPPGQAPVLEMSKTGRSVALMLQSEATAESVMMFEETAPAGTTTGVHIHHDSDEVMYVLSGEITCKIGDQVTVAEMPAIKPHPADPPRPSVMTTST